MAVKTKPQSKRLYREGGFTLEACVWIEGVYSIAKSPKLRNNMRAIPEVHLGAPDPNLA